MAEGYTVSSYNWPVMNWAAADLSREWERFYQHCEFAFGGPFSKYSEKEKNCNLMSFVGDEGRGIFLTFRWETVDRGSGKHRQSVPLRKKCRQLCSAHRSSEYILGKPVVVQTDHKPLEIILRKLMVTAPLQLQAMILKVSSYDFQVEYLPGKKQMLADTLSRASLDEMPPEDDELQVNMVERISITEAKYAQLQQSTANKLHKLYSMIQSGWPETKHEVPHSIRQYWDTRDELAVLDGVICRGMRIVVPPTMRPAMLEIIHETHLGIVKCKQRTREALHWPGTSA